MVERSDGDFFDDYLGLSMYYRRFRLSLLLFWRLGCKFINILLIAYCRSSAF